MDVAGKSSKRERKREENYLAKKRQEFYSRTVELSRVNLTGKLHTPLEWCFSINFFLIDSFGSAAP